MKLKCFALILVITLLLGLICACTGPAATPSGSDSTPVEPSSTYKDMLIGTNFDPDDVTTWYSDTPSYPTAEDIARIQPGMTLKEVFHIIGLPQKSVGWGRFVIEWETDTNSYLQIFLERKSFDRNLSKADRWVVEKAELTDESTAIPLPTKPEPIYDMKDPATWYSDTPSFPTAEDIARIQVGESLTTVFHRIGLPQRDVGSGKTIMEWDLNSGGHLQISFVENYANQNFPLPIHMVVEKIEFVDFGYNPEDQSTWYSDTPSFPKAEDIAKIQPGMPVSLVFYAIGLPQRDVGSGNMILEWDLENGEHLQIKFVKNYANEKLPLATHMVVEKMEATEPDIIPTFPTPTYHEPIYDPNDPITWSSPTTSYPSYPTAQDIARIQPGMVMTEVFRIIGLPQGNTDHVQTIMTWRLNTSGYLQIAFKKMNEDEAGLCASSMVVESLELMPTS